MSVNVVKHCILFHTPWFHILIIFLSNTKCYMRPSWHSDFISPIWWTMHGYEFCHSTYSVSSSREQRTLSLCPCHKQNKDIKIKDIQKHNVIFYLNLFLKCKNIVKLTIGWLAFCYLFYLLVKNWIIQTKDFTDILKQNNSLIK